MHHQGKVTDIVMIPVDETSTFLVWIDHIIIFLLMLLLTLMMLLYSWKCRTIAVSVDSLEVRKSLRQASLFSFL